MFDNANAGEVAARVTKILRIGLTAMTPQDHCKPCRRNLPTDGARRRCERL